MSGLQSNTDALLIAIPMLVFLLAGMFRLDELVGKPRKRGPQRRPMAGLDGRGLPKCLDPDGRVFGERTGREAGVRK